MLVENLTLAAQQNFACPLPIVRELPADLETPVSIYLRLANLVPSFLLESVTGGEHLARYSFIGVNPSQAFILRGRRLECHSHQGTTIHSLSAGENPLHYLRAWLASQPSSARAGLPRFSGGLVGYLGYDLMPCFEPTVPLIPDRLHHDGANPLPDAISLLADTLIAFDHAYGRLLLIANAHTNGDSSAAHAAAEARLDQLTAYLAQPLPPDSSMNHPLPGSALTSNTNREQFIQSVSKAKDYISAGEIFQVVLSQRLSRQTTASPFNIYRALRRLNPSPYMFFFDFGQLAGPQPLRIIGSSPEMHVRLEGKRAFLRPIAGTRPRGDTPEGDQLMQAELLNDPKERAEHVMLVDLARNDLGRVCDYGTVTVPELMGVEGYSHVMHLVSQVTGQLRPGYDAFDLMQATFPAGTVTGAPKIRAMQIIAELENEPRGPYAGAVGYFSYNGSMDTCITIRTLVMQGQQVSVQVGAGIVADSDPESEYQETLNKARALTAAVEMAEEADSNR
jgi:anthranilate synthase component 1